MGYQIIVCQQAGGKHCSLSVYMLLLSEVCGDWGQSCMCASLQFQLRGN